jgi:AraC-like DNA-binding protein
VFFQWLGEVGNAGIGKAPWPTVAYALGHEDPSAFIAMFKAVRGTSPRRFMAGIEAVEGRRDGADRNTGYDAGGDPVEQ